MPDIRAAQSGDFSATSTWVGGVVPGSGDAAFANAFTVTIGDTRTVQAISNAAGTGITVGGTFSLLNGCNLTCTNANGVVQGGTTTSVITTPSLGPGSSAIVVSALSHTGATANTPMVTFSSSGTLNILGPITGGAYSGCPGISATGGGTLNHTGNVMGGSSVNAAGIMVSGATTVNCTGTITGGTNNNGAQGININTTGATVLVTGSVMGGAGFPGAAGILNNNSSTLTVNGSCQSSATAPAIAVGSTAQVTRLSGPFRIGASGNINPVQAASFRFSPTLIPTYWEVPLSSGSAKRLLYTADNMPSGGYPVVANVRQSTVYGPSSEFTGALAVPLPSSVALGVPTDHTVGSAILTAAAVQSALIAQGLTTTRANNLDNIATAADIRAEMDTNSTKLASLDAQMQNKASVDQVAAIVQGATSA